jgi:hypothetical protein
MKTMRKCNDEIYQLAKDQALVKKLKNKIYIYIYIECNVCLIFICPEKLIYICWYFVLQCSVAQFICNCRHDDIHTFVYALLYTNVYTIYIH